MKRKKIKRLLAIFLLGLSLLSFKPIQSFAASTFNLTDSAITYYQKEEINKPRILIYHTHTLEDYKDSNVVEMGKDLAIKLEKKGFVVDHIKDNFSKDYNNAYNKSREYLKGIDLEQYDLVIDYHRDYSPSQNTSNIWNVDVAKVMLVYSKSSGNYENQRSLGDSIVANMDNKITKNNYIYNKGINYFNQDLSKNTLLLEMGNNENDSLHIKRLNTHMADSIEKVINN